MFRTILILGRMSNLPTVWTNVLAGWFIAGGSWTPELLWIEIGISLLYVGGMTLNDAFDANWDREHAPERPIPSGTISRKAVWIVGVGQLVAGIAILLGMTGVDPIWSIALIGAILLYDWIHKKTVWAVLVMGACRALVYVTVASAVADATPFFVWIVAGAMWIYVIGITLVARGERTGEKRTMGLLGRLCLNAPIIVLVLATDQMEKGTLRAVLFVSSILIVMGWLALSEVCLKSSTRLGVGMALAGITLIDAVAVVYVDWKVGLVCLALLPVTLLLQQKIPAT